MRIFLLALVVLGLAIAAPDAAFVAPAAADDGACVGVDPASGQVVVDPHCTKSSAGGDA